MWDLTRARFFAQVVYTATNVYCALLEDLWRVIDLSAVWLGWPDASSLRNKFILWEMTMTCGDRTAVARADSSRMRARPLALPTHAGRISE